MIMIISIFMSGAPWRDHFQLIASLTDLYITFFKKRQLNVY